MAVPALLVRSTVKRDVGSGRLRVPVFVGAASGQWGRMLLACDFATGVKSSDRPRRRQPVGRSWTAWLSNNKLL